MPENKSSLLIFETHPIQYRVPIYRRLQELIPNRFKVTFASDFSIRAYQDPGFGDKLSWDINLIDGYPSQFLNINQKSSPKSRKDLPRFGVASVIREQQPRAILLNSLVYDFDREALRQARVSGAQIWLRQETQDQAFERTFWKTWARTAIYRRIYKNIDRCFAIGNLSVEHYINHGVNKDKIRHARYCTADPFQDLNTSRKLDFRNRIREELSLNKSDILIGFFGKLIPKKNPDLLLDSIRYLPSTVRERVAFLFVGTGELEPQLKHLAWDAEQQYGVKSHFAGFINQTQLASWYLATDVLVLPSRRMGETWGLVANEALLAGCSVILSDAVGSSADFGSWERVQTIPVGNTQALAHAITELSQVTRDFDWARDRMQQYSIEATAQSYISELEPYL